MAQHAGKHLHQFITKHEAYKQGNYELAMKRAFLELDEAMQLNKVLKDAQAGTTAIVVLIKDNILYSVSHKLINSSFHTSL